MAPSPNPLDNVFRLLCPEEETRRLARRYFRRVRSMREGQGTANLPTSVIHICAWYALESSGEGRGYQTLLKVQKASTASGPTEFMNSVSTIQKILHDAQKQEQLTHSLNSDQPLRHTPCNGLPTMEPPCYACQAQPERFCLRVQGEIKCALCLLKKKPCRQCGQDDSDDESYVPPSDATVENSSESEPGSVRISTSSARKDRRPGPSQRPKLRGSKVEGKQLSAGSAIPLRTSHHVEQSAPAQPEQPTQTLPASLAQTPQGSAPSISQQPESHIEERATSSSLPSSKALGKRPASDPVDRETADKRPSPGPGKVYSHIGSSRRDHDQQGIPQAPQAHIVASTLLSGQHTHWPFMLPRRTPPWAPLPVTLPTPSSTPARHDHPSPQNDITKNHRATIFQLVRLAAWATISFVEQHECEDIELYLKILDMQTRLRELDRLGSAPAAGAQPSGTATAEASESLRTRLEEWVLQYGRGIVAYVKEHDCPDVELKMKIMDLETRLKLL